MGENLTSGASVETRTYLGGSTNRNLSLGFEEKIHLGIGLKV